MRKKCVNLMELKLIIEIIFLILLVLIAIKTEKKVSETEQYIKQILKGRVTKRY